MLDIVMRVISYAPALVLLLEAMVIMNALVLKKVKVEPGSKRDLVVSYLFDASVLTAIICPVLALSTWLYTATKNGRFNLISIFVVMMYVFFLTIDFKVVRENNLRNRKRNSFEKKRFVEEKAEIVGQISKKQKAPKEETKIIPFPDKAYIDSVVAEVHATYKENTKSRKTYSSNVNRGVFSIEVE